MKNEKKERPIIKPQPVHGFHRKLIIHLPYLPPKVDLISLIQKRAIKFKQFEGFTLYLLPRNVLIYGAIGAPLAIMVGERLIASGGQEIILLGFAGSLSPSLKIGQAILVEKAIADEGTSRHYLPLQEIIPSSKELTARIEKRLEEQGLEIRRAVVISTDAPYRETRNWLLRAQKKGAEAVDMETSAWLALAKFYRLRAAALLLISDELFSFRWRSGFSYPSLWTNCRNYFYPLLDFS
ncbi:MAG: nucleoside phosphorylase [Candidatus Aminicenantes bacterium]|nr:nucleoside phosphorylase [Candidatus Aminicenantes bacterium]